MSEEKFEETKPDESTEATENTEPQAPKDEAA